MTDTVPPPAAAVTVTPRARPARCLIGGPRGSAAESHLERDKRTREGTLPAISDGNTTSEKLHRSNLHRGDMKESFFIPGPRSGAIPNSLRELKKLHVLPTGQRAENGQVFEVLKIFMRDKKILCPCMAFRVPLDSPALARQDTSANRAEEAGEKLSSSTDETELPQDSSMPSRSHRSSLPYSSEYALSTPSQSSAALFPSGLSTSSSFPRPPVSSSAFFSSSPDSVYRPSSSIVPPSKKPSSFSSSSVSRSFPSSTISSAPLLPKRPSACASGRLPRTTTYVIVDCSPASGLLTADTLVYLSGAPLQRLRRVQLMALVHPNSAYGRRAGICSYQQVFDKRPDFPCIEQDDQLLLRDAPAHVRGFDITAGGIVGEEAPPSVAGEGIENSTEAPVHVLTTPPHERTVKREEDEKEEEKGSKEKVEATEKEEGNEKDEGNEKEEGNEKDEGNEKKEGNENEKGNEKEKENVKEEKKGKEEENRKREGNEIQEDEESAGNKKEETKREDVLPDAVMYATQALVSEGREKHKQEGQQACQSFSSRKTPLAVASHKEQCCDVSEVNKTERRSEVSPAFGNSQGRVSMLGKEESRQQHSEDISSSSPNKLHPITSNNARVSIRSTAMAAAGSFSAPPAADVPSLSSPTHTVAGSLDDRCKNGAIVVDSNAALPVSDNVVKDCSGNYMKRNLNTAPKHLQSFCMKWYRNNCRRLSEGNINLCTSASSSKDNIQLSSGNTTGKLQDSCTSLTSSRRSSCSFADRGNTIKSRGKGKKNTWNIDRSVHTTVAGRENASNDSSISRLSSSQSTSSVKRESRRRTVSIGQYVPGDISLKDALRKATVSPGENVRGNLNSNRALNQPVSSQLYQRAWAKRISAVRGKKEEVEEGYESTAEQHAADNFLDLSPSTRSSAATRGDDLHADKELGEKNMQQQQRHQGRPASRGNLHVTGERMPSLQHQHQQQETTHTHQRRRTLCIEEQRDNQEKDLATAASAGVDERVDVRPEDEVYTEAETEGEEKRGILQDGTYPSSSETPSELMLPGREGEGQCVAETQKAAKAETTFLWCDTEGTHTIPEGKEEYGRDSTRRGLEECPMGSGPSQSFREAKSIKRRASLKRATTTTSRGLATESILSIGTAGRTTTRATMRPAQECEKVRLQRLDAETLFREFVGPYLQRKLGKRNRNEKEEVIEKRKEYIRGRRKGEGDGEKIDDHWANIRQEGNRETRDTEEEKEEKAQPKATLVVYPGKELVIRDVTFVVWAADPAGVPGLLDEDTVIYICLDPYGEYRRVHFVPFSDTLPTTYEFDFYEDYLKLFLLENKWRNFRRGDVYSYRTRPLFRYIYFMTIKWKKDEEPVTAFICFDSSQCDWHRRGVEFKLIATEPSVSAGARVGPATIVYHEGTMQPTVMDVLPADVLYHIRRLPARMQPTAIIFAAQRLDPEVLMRVVPSTSTMRSRRGLNEQTAEKLREKLVTPFSFASYFKKYPDLCCRVSPSAEQSTENTSARPFGRRLTRSNKQQSTCWRGNYKGNSSVAEKLDASSDDQQSSSERATHVGAGGQGSRDENRFWMAGASVMSGETANDSENVEKRALHEPTGVAVAGRKSGNTDLETREDPLEKVHMTDPGSEGREGYSQKVNAEDYDEELRKFERPSCTVCTLPMEERDASIILFCGHVFHWQCIHLWLRYNSTCPNCRAEITELFRQHEESLRRRRASESSQEGDFADSHGESITQEEGAFDLVNSFRRWVSTAMFGGIEL